MARAATTADVFNAVAEKRRRDIVEALLDGEQRVTDLALRLGQSQTQLSKHLRVLKDVNLVTAHVNGREHHYRLNPSGLKSVHEWVSQFERLWTERFDALDDVLAQMQGTDPDTFSSHATEQEQP